MTLAGNLILQDPSTFQIDSPILATLIKMGWSTVAGPQRWTDSTGSGWAASHVNDIVTTTRAHNRKRETTRVQYYQLIHHPRNSALNGQQTRPQSLGGATGPRHTVAQARVDDLAYRRIPDLDQGALSIHHARPGPQARQGRPIPQTLQALLDDDGDGHAQQHAVHGGVDAPQRGRIVSRIRIPRGGGAEQDAALEVGKGPSYVFEQQGGGYDGPLGEPHQAVEGARAPHVLHQTGQDGTVVGGLVSGGGGDVAVGLVRDGGGGIYPSLEQQKERR